MEIRKMPEPRVASTAPRWMSDSDLNKDLVIEEVTELDDGTIQVVFSTPLLERVRRTMRSDRSEYAFIYNTLKDGQRSVKYVKRNGFRIPVAAE